MKRISVLMANDHSILTDAVVQFLRRACEVLGIAHDGKTMVEMAEQHSYDKPGF